MTIAPNFKKHIRSSSDFEHVAEQINLSEQPTLVFYDCDPYSISIVLIVSSH